MGVVVWGELEKSQIDPEKIEEAIGRLIAEHNDDESAHLGAGQSLQSHKASTIIDHLVSSIIASTIRDGEVVVPKFGWDRFFIMPELESADAWNKTIEGNLAAIECQTVGCLRLKSGDALGNKSVVFIEHPFIAVNEDTDPVLSARLDDDGAGGQDIGLAIGSFDPFAVNQKMVGIKYIKADAKLYAFYIYYSAGAYYEVKYEIGTAPPAGEVYKIAVDSANTLLLYYVNSVLKKSIDYSENPPSIDSSVLFSIGCKNANAGHNFTVYLTSPIYYQNWS
jgi:hypothetical protein